MRTPTIPRNDFSFLGIYAFFESFFKKGNQKDPSMDLIGNRVKEQVDG